MANLYALAQDLGGRTQQQDDSIVGSITIDGKVGTYYGVFDGHGKEI